MATSSSTSESKRPQPGYGDGSGDVAPLRKAHIGVGIDAVTPATLAHPEPPAMAVLLLAPPITLFVLRYVLPSLYNLITSSILSIGLFWAVFAFAANHIKKGNDSIPLSLAFSLFH
jgi:hypothetical protein